MNIPKTFRRGVLSVVCGVSFAMTGCAVDQSKEVAQYREVLDATHLPPTNRLPEGETLSLSQAMSLANQHNEDLGLRGEDYVQALIDKNRAVANFLPTVSFEPSYTIADRHHADTVVAGLRPRGSTLQGYALPVVGEINVFNGFGDVANLRAVEAIIAQRRELLLDLQATILLNVAQTYYQVLRSEQAVDVLKNSLALQESRLSDVEQQFRNGLATQLAVSQTRAQVDGTRVQLVQAQSDVRNGRFTLALLIGVPRVNNALADSFAIPSEPGSETAFEEVALKQRNDVLAAQQQLLAARQGVDVAVSQYYPSVSLNVEALLDSSTFADASRWNGVLAAHLPIFSAGRIHADVRTAWSRVRQAALDESSVRRQVLHDVQTSYENFTTAERRIKELDDEVKAANEAYEQARNAFLNGLGLNLDVLSAQDQLLNAQLQLTGARFDRTVFYLNMLRAIGRLPQEFAVKSA